MKRAISKNATAVSDNPDTLPVSDGPAPPVIVGPLTRHGRLCDPIACTTPALADKPPVAPARPALPELRWVKASRARLEDALGPAVFIA